MSKPYETGVSSCGRYVYARSFQTPITFDVAIAYAADLVQLYREHDAKTILIDVRGTTSVVTISENYDFAYRGAEQLQAPRSARIAVVHDPGDASLGFFETVMLNAGFNVRLFSNPDGAAPDDSVPADAVAWITE